MSTLTSSRVLAPIGTAGKLFAFGLDVFRGLFRRPFQLREFLQQAWFIASVTIVPTALVAIPFGAVIALQVGTIVTDAMNQACWRNSRSWKGRRNNPRKTSRPKAKSLPAVPIGARTRDDESVDIRRPSPGTCCPRTSQAAA